LLPLHQHLVQLESRERLFLLVALFFESQRLVVDVTGTASRTAHLALLFAVRLQLELERLSTFHGGIIIWSMKKSNDLRHGRHCSFAMHVHLVFVTKYRRCILDGEAIEKLRHIFSKVCTDFAALLVQMDGESNHLHLLVNYPPKVSVSSLVNSLKGVSSYVLRRQLPRIAKCYWKNVLWSPSYFAASCGGAPLDVIKRYIEQQATPL
jgi:putative transposase